MLDLDNISRLKKLVKSIISQQDEYDLQEILASIHQKYAKRDKIEIRYRDIPLQFIFKKEKLPSGESYYHLYSDEQLDISQDNMYSLNIYFYHYDIVRGEIDFNSAYIAEIHKNFNIGFISGRFIVELIITLLSALQIHTAYLIDAAVVNCDLDGEELILSLFKILEKGHTFYQSYEFNPVLSANLYPDIFADNKQFITTFNQKRDFISGITVGTIYAKYMKLFRILTRIVSDIGYNKMDIECYQDSLVNLKTDKYSTYTLTGANIPELLLRHIKQLTVLLKMMESHKSKKFAKWITSLECNKYNLFIRFFFNETGQHNIYKLKYKKSTFIDDIIPQFLQMKKLILYSHYRRVFK
jgi:hypothetical protein